MTADWTFKLTQAPKRIWYRPFSAPKAPEPREWSRRTRGQSVVQFAPAHGKLETEVTLRYSKTSCGPTKGEIAVVHSRRNLYRRLVEKGEFSLLLVSAAIALVSGLVLYYVPNATFGSLQDYLALFTWGIGVDQGKNLVQTLQDLRKQSQPDDAE